VNEAAPDAVKFAQAGYQSLPGLLGGSELAAVASWARSMNTGHGGDPADDQVAGAPAFYAPAVTEFLLVKLQLAVEAATGSKLFPTYSYLRIYKTGSELTPHTDRPACEFTLSLALGFDGDVPWPIHLATPSGPRAFDMAPGDGLLYRGCGIAHWRDAFEGTYCAQAFLHYIDRNGPHAGQKFDGRSAVHAPSAGRGQTNAG
jgi:hypothetical protein